jgi:hypothetical protein
MFVLLDQLIDQLALCGTVVVVEAVVEANCAVVLVLVKVVPFLVGFRTV